MSATSPRQSGLCEGIKELLDEALGAKSSKAKLCTDTTALALVGENGKPPSDLVLSNLIKAMWMRIATNWVETKCRWSGSKNWRWELCPKLDETKQKPDREVPLNRKLAQYLKVEAKEGRWANEIPTASGLAPMGPGGLDLAYFSPPDRICLIELKRTAENPISAAFQVVEYGLVLQLVRLVHARLKPIRGEIKIADQWSGAKHADLRVLAPDTYYKRFPKLRQFERSLDDAVETFGRNQDLKMGFGFRYFDRAPTNELELLAALSRTLESD